MNKVELSYKELVMISTSLSHLREYYKGTNDDVKEEVIMLKYKIDNIIDEDE